MIDDERLEECNLNLGRADVDGDGELHCNEFAPLVASLSQGRIIVEKFRDLPLRLRMIFHWIACSCVFEPDADLNCCIGDAAHVNIDDVETSLPFMVNRLFCSELRRGIDCVEDHFPAVTHEPSALPSVSPSTSPTTSGPSSSPSTISPTTLPTVAPTMEESSSPTTRGPSSSPSTNAPSNSPSTIHPSTSPSVTPTLEESSSPTEEPPPSAVPSFVPSETITEPPTVAPTATPTNVPPPETLCITFQYELVNNRSLSADDVLNENNNTLKTGLIEATETLVIRILNETFPRIARARPAQFVPKAEGNRPAIHDPHDWEWKKPPAATRHDPHDWSWSDIGQRRLPVLREAVARADAAVLGVDVDLYSFTIQDELSGMYNSTRRNRRLHASNSSYIRGSRRLVYYTDEFPVEIPIIVDNPNCPANNENGANTIRCAIVSSEVCVVLEAGDDPQMIRRALVDGLSSAIDSGEFEDLIPQERLDGKL